MKGDYMEAFERLKSNMFEVIEGVKVEKVKEGYYLWGGTYETQEQIKMVISNVTQSLNNSIRK